MSRRKASTDAKFQRQRWLEPQMAPPARRPGHVSGLFALDRGLFLLPSRIALDVTRRQAIGFVSHAHMDHAAFHALALCTAETATVLRHRLGDVPVRILPFGEPQEVAGQRLMALPAGHIWGAAMLYAEHERGSLLYTGDFRLEPSATTPAAELCPADFLIMECTFGHPRYRMPPRNLAIEMLLEKVTAAIRRGATPVISAYVLGKAQDLTKILTSHGIPVFQHPDIYKISQIYEAAGCRLGDFRLYEERPLAGTAVLMPPNRGGLPGALHVERFQVTGWAMDPARRRQRPGEHWIPLSDHADFDQLIRAVEQVSPKTVFCTHGPKSFVKELTERGWDARWLGS